VVETILNKEFELPLLPHVAIKVIRITNDANSNMADLAKVVMTDQMMATKIIKIANSPVYAGTVKITDIKQALVRVGQGEIRNMMLAVSLGSKVFRSGLYGRLAKELWEHAVGCAFAARVVAHGLRKNREQAFLCGLMHDLGKMIMLNILEQCQRKERKGFRPSKGTILELWNRYQQDVGELAVTNWNLPQIVSHVVQHHSKLNEIEEDEGDMAAVTALGDAFCRLKGIGQDPEEELDLSSQEASQRLNLAPETIFELLERFYQLFEQTKHEFM
jgi:HD-like signal output (HDOD) protein